MHARPLVPHMCHTLNSSFLRSLPYSGDRHTQVGCSRAAVTRNHGTHVRSGVDSINAQRRQQRREPRGIATMGSHLRLPACSACEAPSPVKGISQRTHQGARACVRLFVVMLRSFLFVALFTSSMRERERDKRKKAKQNKDVYRCARTAHGGDAFQAAGGITE